MNKLSLALCGSLALGGCAKPPFTQAKFDYLATTGAEIGERKANAVLNRLGGKDITEANIDQAYFYVGETLIKMVELCRADVENVIEGTQHQISRGTFEFKADGEKYPIKSIIVDNSGPDDAQDYTLMSFDFGLDEIPNLGVVSESRRPNQSQYVTEAEFDEFVRRIFGDAPAWDCIEAEK
jgi:hypothetical protein